MSPTCEALARGYVLRGTGSYASPAALEPIAETLNTFIDIGTGRAPWRVTYEKVHRLHPPQGHWQTWLSENTTVVEVRVTATDTDAHTHALKLLTRECVHEGEHR